jgi:hypothetical protein
MRRKRREQKVLNKTISSRSYVGGEAEKLVIKIMCQIFPLFIESVNCQHHHPFFPSPYQLSLVIHPFPFIFITPSFYGHHICLVVHPPSSVNSDEMI